MPRRSQEAYCNRAVCPSVCHSVCNKLFSSLTENQALKQATQAELVIYSDLNWRSLVLKLRSRVMAWFAYLDCRGWRSGLYWRQNCPHLTAWRLVASICTTDSTAGPEKLRQKAMAKSTATSLACWYMVYIAVTPSWSWLINISLCLHKGGAPNFGRFLISDKLAFMLDFSETR